MRQDQEEDFRDYVAGRGAALRRTAFLVAGDWHDAEDAVSVVFVRLYLRWASIRAHSALDAWTRTAVIRVVLDQRRRGWSRRERVAETLPDRAEPVADIDERLTVRAALQQVPRRQRAVLVLRYWEDLSVRETAVILNCTSGTVKSQTARGLVALRRALGDDVAADGDHLPGTRTR